jgi:hypothetical protein
LHSSAGSVGGLWSGAALAVAFFLIAVGPLILVSNAALVRKEELLVAFGRAEQTIERLDGVGRIPRRQQARRGARAAALRS